MRLSFKAKMFGIFLIVGGILLSVGLVNFYALYKTGKNFQKVSEQAVPKLKNLTLLQGYSKEAGMTAMRLSGYLQNTDKIEELQSDYKKWTMRYSEMLDVYNKYDLSDEEKNLLSEVSAKWSKLNDLSLKAFSSALAAKTPAQRTEVENLINDDIDLTLTEFNASFAKVSGYLNDSSDALAREISSFSKLFQIISLVLVSTGFIGTLFLGWFFSARSYNTLVKVVAELKNNSAHIITSANETKSRSATLDTQIIEEAAAIKETMSATEEISSMVDKTADGTRQSLDSTEECKSVFSHTKKSMHDLFTSIEHVAESFKSITSTVNKNYSEVKEVSKLIQEIKTKTSVVNDIVFQTRLLSFNASVEAARAGEHGKGFAVVAEEVGKLANMSGQAAKEINEMIDSSAEKIQSVFSKMQTEIESQLNNGKQTVAVGQKNVQDCLDSFQKVNDSIDFLEMLSKDISTAAEEQKRGVKEINQAINNIDASSQINSTSSKEVSLLAERFNSISLDLSQAVNEISQLLVGYSEQGTVKK